MEPVEMKYRLKHTIHRDGHSIVPLTYEPDEDEEGKGYPAFEIGDIVFDRIKEEISGKKVHELIVEVDKGLEEVRTIYLDDNLKLTGKGTWSRIWRLQHKLEVTQ